MGLCSFSIDRHRRLLKRWLFISSSERHKYVFFTCYYPQLIRSVSIIVNTKDSPQPCMTAWWLTACNYIPGNKSLLYIYPPHLQRVNIAGIMLATMGKYQLSGIPQTQWPYQFKSVEISSYLKLIFQSVNSNMYMSQGLGSSGRKC